VVGDAAATGLAPGSLDVAVLRHVLAHNGGREQTIVDHLASSVRPGGCVHLVDVDYTAVRMPPVDQDLEDLSGRYRGQGSHARRVPPGAGSDRSSPGAHGATASVTAAVFGLRHDRPGPDYRGRTERTGRPRPDGRRGGR
jgi:hypothetical protein